MLRLFKSFSECLVSSQSIMSDFFKVSIALRVISPRFPIGVETIYKPFFKSFISSLKKIILLTYILLSLNQNSFADENEKLLKVGLLAPFSGEYRDMGQSIMLSLQLALDEIDDDNIKIFPRDSGFNNPKKLMESVESFKDENIKIVIGPISHEDFKHLSMYKEMIFISPSNIDPKIQNNILSVGVSLESQIKSIENFVKEKKKKKTIIIYPKNKYTPLIDSKISKEANISL